MKQKIIKSGNSLAITIPSKFIKHVGINLGDEVEVKTDIEKASIKLNFHGHKQLGLLKNS